MAKLNENIDPHLTADTLPDVELKGEVVDDTAELLKSLPADSPLLSGNYEASELTEDDFDSFGVADQGAQFPAYWRPEEGAMFHAIVLHSEEAEANTKGPDERFQLQAMRPTRCWRGAKNEATEEIVKPGENFSMGVYHGLPLNRYIGMEIMVKAVGKSETASGNEVWRWAVKVDKQAGRELKEESAALTAALRNYHAKARREKLLEMRKQMTSSAVNRLGA